MNELFRPEFQPRTTNAAEGLPRRRWSVAEIDAMVRAGVIAEDERFELIGAEAVPMSPKGARHEWIKMELNTFLQRAAPDHLAIIPETTLRLDEFSFIEPDFCVFRRDLEIEKLNGRAVLLAIEIADTSLAYDLGREIAVYAGHGAREVWVINVDTLVTRVHRGLNDGGYAEVFDVSRDQDLMPALAPDLSVNPSNIGLTPLADG